MLSPTAAAPPLTPPATSASHSASLSASIASASLRKLGFGSSPFLSWVIRQCYRLRRYRLPTPPTLLNDDTPSLLQKPSAPVGRTVRATSFLLAALVVLATLVVLANSWLAWKSEDAEPSAIELDEAAEEEFSAADNGAAAGEANANVFDWPAGRVAPSNSGRYLLFMPAAGYANQLYGFVKAMTVANAFNRTLVVPPLLSSHIINQHGWFDKRKETNSTLRIRVRLQTLLHHEELARYTRINASVLATREYVLLSDLVQWQGRAKQYDCWKWPGKRQYYGAGNYSDTNATVLCIGVTHGMPPINRTEQPLLRFDAPVRDWLILDDEIVSDSRQWLQYAKVDTAAYSCVHYRAGDFKQFAGRNYVNLSGLVQRVNATLGIQRHTVLITNTEDADERKQLRRLPWRELSPEHVYTLEPVDKLRDVKKLHMDIHMCALARSFIGCERSSMSRIIREMRGCAYNSSECSDYCNYPPKYI